MDVAGNHTFEKGVGAGSALDALSRRFDQINIILYMATPGCLTGAPRRLITLAELLSELGLGVCVASESGQELLEVAQMRGLQIAPVDAPEILKLRRGALFGGGVLFRVRVVLALLRQNWHFLKMVRKRKVDVVWVRGSKGIAFAGLGALMSGQSLVWDVDYELPSRGLIRWLHRFGLWASQAVVFQYAAASEEIFGKKLAHRYRHKSHFLIPGVDLNRLEPHAKARRAHYPSRGHDLFSILQVGTICDRKNQRLTIDALRIAVDRGLGNKWKLFLAYDEIQDVRIREYVRESRLGANVEFLGWRDDISALMEGADLLLMPSKDEGVPNAVQEAMFIGVPVIASKAGGIPEIVDDGRTGWLLALDDPAAWAARIVWSKNYPDKREKVGLAASEFARRNFGTERWGKLYSDIVRYAVRNTS
jgi:glycosyltransferase involved in cell wall biosynthesis